MYTPGFTLPEVLIVLGLISVILLVAYKVFFSQAKLVSQSVEFMRVNDDFRRILLYLGNDIREANFILKPAPIRAEDATNAQTPAGGGEVLRLVKQEIDPTVKFSGSLPAKWNASDTWDQVVRTREVFYTLERIKAKEGPLKNIPRYKLIRTEYLQDANESGAREKQVLEITDTVREFTVFRTQRKPMKALNVSKIKERILAPMPSYEAGTGGDLVHLKITLERKRTAETGTVYDITLGTSFYKRGKEVWLHQ